MNTDKVQRGGKRIGAGRKHLDPARRKVSVNYRLNPDIVSWLRSQDSAASVLIENALIKTHGLKF